jgi:hypothetical protein
VVNRLLVRHTGIGFEIITMDRESKDILLKPCDEAERLWTSCLKAGISYRYSVKMELILLRRLDPNFRSFEEDIEVARGRYVTAKNDLDDHLQVHRCGRQLGKFDRQ